jgi:hypothetical protein
MISVTCTSNLRFRVRNTSSLVILTSLYINAAVFCNLSCSSSADDQQVRWARHDPRGAGRCCAARALDLLSLLAPVGLPCCVLPLLLRALSISHYCCGH